MGLNFPFKFINKLSMFFLPRYQGKPHMALQQFRKALTACSIVPPPSLFNVAVTYRDLGEEEAEMESLHLLEQVSAFILSSIFDVLQVASYPILSMLYCVKYPSNLSMKQKYYHGVMRFIRCFSPNLVEAQCK